MRSSQVACRWLGILGAVLVFAACQGPGPAPGSRALHTMPTESIRGEVVWEGRVLVDRIVIVRSDGHLVVRPGTQIRFRRIDWDQDGIGDAEITVEGRLTAEGTAAAPIRFLSAEAEPQPGDWKYLMVNFATGASLAHVSVAHAFSGIQVHYSPARIRRSEFTENVDGVRFSTARLTVEESWIHHNTNGVRFEERGHPATFAGNEIADNHVGIFAVTECRGGSDFRSNNIRRNRYAVKLGWEQESGLALGGNYWGTVRTAEVLDTVLDGRERTEGPAVDLTPMLSAAVDVTFPPFATPAAGMD